MADCESSARRLLAAIAGPVEVDGRQLFLTASIGIALNPTDADGADTLLRRADEAMYVAKHTGRNQFVLWADGAEEPANEAPVPWLIGEKRAA